MYHINPATGIISHCNNYTECTQKADFGEHYHNYNSAELALDTNRSINFFNAVSELPFKVDDNFHNVFERAIGSGFVKNDSTPEEVEKQLDILRLPIIFDYLSMELSVLDNEFERLRYIKVMCWIIRDYALRYDLENFDCYKNIYENRIISLFDRQNINSNLSDYILMDEKELVNFSCNLWLYKNSPFHDYAKALLLLDDNVVDGYVPCSVQNCIKYDNSTIVDYLGIDKVDLMDDYIAYDIETDTSYGYGLRPTKSQITELVISCKDYSYVFSGDEKYILESFANFMNNNTKKGAILAGWNNFSFDNIVLQTRAEYHNISNWNGVLLPAESYTVFEPVGPTPHLQQLRWRKNDGAEVKSIDLFQRKCVLDNLRGDVRHSIGLKPFVESLGCYPVIVDRHNLHLLDINERMIYVLSDGLSTLRAVKELV